MASGDGFLVRLSLSPRLVRYLSEANVIWTTQWRHMDMGHRRPKALAISLSARVGIRQCPASELQRYRRDRADRWGE